MKKFTVYFVCGFAATLLLTSCDGMKSRKETVSDCSSVFESRYVNADKNTYTTKQKKEKSVSKDKKDKSGVKVNNEKEMAEDKPATECKILKIKLDNNTSCEIVGSDKVDNLAQTLSENKQNKIILVTPQDKLQHLSKMAQTYLVSNGIDVQKHFESDLVKNLNFPYKGMRCEASGKEFVIWAGEKRVIITVGNL